MKQMLITAERCLIGAQLQEEKRFALLIGQQKILEIGPADTLRAKYPQADVIDYGDATILPGLIDCHNHLDWDCTIPDYVNESQGCESRLTIIGLRNTAADLRSGVTSSRYMGGHFFLDVKFREYIQSGFIAGPKILASGIGLRSSAGHGYIGIPCDGDDALIHAVRNNLLQHVDWIKFYSTGSHLNEKGFPSSYYTRHETELIIDMAHRAGIPATSHCVGGPGMTDAIECGIDCLEHCYFATDSHIESMLKAGTHVCLTMSEYFTEKPNMPPAMQKKFEQFRPIVHERMQALIHSGVPVVLGTDGMHGHLWQEALYFTQHGGSRYDALQALTVHAAKLLGIFDETGSLEKGKIADLVVAAGNPLADITALNNICAVYHNGNAVDL